MLRNNYRNIITKPLRTYGINKLITYNSLIHMQKKRNITLFDVLQTAQSVTLSTAVVSASIGAWTGNKSKKPDDDDDITSKSFYNAAAILAGSSLVIGGIIMKL